MAAQGLHASDEPRVSIDDMLASGLRLFSARGYDGVSVREMASELGVTHPLIHYYLGSKSEIFGAVLRHHEKQLLLPDACADLAEALGHFVSDGLCEHGAYLRLVAHAAMDHGSARHPDLEFASARELLRLANECESMSNLSEDDAEIQLAVASVIALCVGWCLLEPWFVSETDLLPMNEVERRQKVAALALDLFRLHARQGGVTAAAAAADAARG